MQRREGVDTRKVSWNVDWIGSLNVVAFENREEMYPRQSNSRCRTECRQETKGGGRERRKERLQIWRRTFTDDDDDDDNNDNEDDIYVATRRDTILKLVRRSR